MSEVPVTPGLPPAGGDAPPERRRSTVPIWIGLAVVVALVGVAALASTAPDPDPSVSASSTVPAGSASSSFSGVTIDGPVLTAPIPEGNPIPEFSAPTLDGGDFIWSARPEGPAVLAIWAPWCPHCQAELPRLAAAAEDHPGVSLISIATAVDAQPGPTPQEYMDAEGLSFPVALDDDEATLATGLGVQGFPTTYFVDADGRVIVSASGELDPAAVDEVLTFLEQQDG
jgi:thiol-disulfide isomerase/thioredoxin